MKYFFTRIANSTKCAKQCTAAYFMVGPQRATRGLWALGAGLLLAATPALAQTTSIVPVAVTGYTADVVANGADNPLATTSAAFDTRVSNVLMEKGYSLLSLGAVITATGGLPPRRARDQRHG